MLFSVFQAILHMLSEVCSSVGWTHLIFHSQMMSCIYFTRCLWYGKADYFGCLSWKSMKKHMPQKSLKELTVAWLLTKIRFSMAFLFFSFFKYHLYRILMMNCSDSCQSQTNWSVTVQRTWILLYDEVKGLELTLTSGILKSKLGKRIKKSVFFYFR